MTRKIKKFKKEDYFDFFELHEEWMRKDKGYRQMIEEQMLYQHILIAILMKRAEDGITQKELADRVGMKQSAVSRIEIGDCVPSIVTLQKIANGVGLTIDVRPTKGDDAPKSIGIKLKSGRKSTTNLQYAKMK